jgi:hypothetical protein
MRAALEELKERGRLGNVATEGDGVTPSLQGSNLQLCPLIPEHPVFAALPWAAKVRRAVASLLLEGPEKGTALCYLSQTFWKPASQVSRIQLSFYGTLPDCSLTPARTPGQIVGVIRSRLFASNMLPTTL